MTVTYEQYNKDMKAFFDKHNWNYVVNTSSMDEFGRYWKTYFFDDGAQWCEAMSPSYERGTIEIKKVKICVEVKMLRTEYWTNEDATSKYYYEKF